MKEKKTIQNLSNAQCDVLTVQEVEIEGEMIIVGQTMAVYTNTKQGIEMMREKEPEYITNAALTFWNNTEG